ncbi:MAG: ABC transporter substrate-binding protein, partial [Vulcanimicrobiaceae bacterium]
VSNIYVPPSANDFLPFAQKLKDTKADMVYVAWAGATAPAMWKALDDAGIPSVSRIVTGLDQRSSYATFGPIASKITFLSHYFYQAASNRVNAALVNALRKQGKVPDLFDPDGFVAAQMVVHAIEVGGDDVPKMTSALSGWSFLAPKGAQTIRDADHAMMQPMFVARLVSAGGGFEPQLVRTIPATAVAPPVHPFK